MSTCCLDQTAERCCDTWNIIQNSNASCWENDEVIGLDQVIVGLLPSFGANVLSTCVKRSWSSIISFSCNQAHTSLHARVG